MQKEHNENGMEERERWIIEWIVYNEMINQLGKKWNSHPLYIKINSNSIMYFEVIKIVKNHGIVLFFRIMEWGRAI